jgi:hypothetical protein
VTQDNSKLIRDLNKINDEIKALKSTRKTSVAARVDKLTIQELTNKIDGLSKESTRIQKLLAARKRQSK